MTTGEEYMELLDYHLDNGTINKEQYDMMLMVKGKNDGIKKLLEEAYKLHKENELNRLINKLWQQ